MPNTLDIENLLDPNLLAREIAKKWDYWDSLRREWKEEKKELRNYVYATDTRTTTNKQLPWFNSTITPKITQIYDNLKANYSAALFPSSKWMKWEADDYEAANKAKADTIQAYMENKLRQSKFTTEVDKIVDDFVLFGNCFGTVEFVREVYEKDGEPIVGYVGPRVVRISPYDIVFDPTASNFGDSPKITRAITTLGELKKKGLDEEVASRIANNRKAVLASSDVDKSDAFVADGFSNIQHYYGSGYIEILTFYGDAFDPESGDFLEARKIEVIDRAYILSDEPIASWLGKEPIFHAGWRNRPDNMWAMGPLDNLVGMQYRINHLENLKADVFDLIAFPVLKVKGDVEDFDYEPGTRIIMGEEGDVAPLVPDTTALSADMQIQTLENKMEEFAGAPRQAMGIRTPGEKTAFEVQTLSSSSSRIFEHKAAKFEVEFLEPCLMAMLESARRNMDSSELIRILDEETGAMLFQAITKEDITAKGKLVPWGARHFAEKARRVQTLMQLQQVKADPTVAPHLSGKVMARIIAQELDEPELFEENVSIREQAETSMAAQDAEADMMEELQVAAEEGL